MTDLLHVRVRCIQYVIIGSRMVGYLPWEKYLDAVFSYVIHLPAQSDAIFAEYDRVKRLTLRVFQTVAVVLDFCRIQSECVL